jgi:hypothetical protein
VENRTARRTHRRATAARLRNRARTHRAASRLPRTGVATLAGHAVAAGLRVREARSAAGTMRKCAARIGVTGTPGRSYAGRAAARDCTRYTVAEAALVGADYSKRARKPEYRRMAVRLTRTALQTAA